jgi:polysaccharide export outer membrane protein
MKLLTLLILSLTTILGQKPNVALSADPSPEEIAAKAASINLPEQRVGPGDLLSISVANCPELTRNFRVAADGTLSLPLLKQRIKVVGKDPDEIETDISTALVNDEVLVRPVVSASVVEYRSVPVSVMGAVKLPITFQAVGNMTLLDALTKAEGLAPDAGSEILVSKGRGAGSSGLGGEQALVQRIPVHALIDEADPSLNIRLYGGEEIRVPPAGRVYVLGNVKKSGAFPIQDNNDATVLKAIALSEGLLPFSNKEAYIYRREAGKQNRDEILIELAKIINRKSPDVHLQQNDILFIPDSKGRKLTAQTLDRIASFGSATATGLVVWH